MVSVLVPADALCFPHSEDFLTSAARPDFSGFKGLPLQVLRVVCTHLALLANIVNSIKTII